MTEAAAPARLLVVDDTPANIRILSDALRDDHDIAVALNGPDALEIAAQNPPDLVLLDIMMPDMDGYEVCRRLKADAATASIPVIFVTAMSEVSDETRGLELGAVDYITKPFNLDIVRARVRTQLALARALSQVRSQNEELLRAARLKEDVDRITRHDLKNPLTTVLSVPQLLLMAENLDTHQRDMLARVEESGYDMLRQINFSLDLFKMEQGSYTLTPEVVDVAALTRQVFREVGELARDFGVALALEVAGAPDDGAAEFPVTAEQLLCRSMVGNLVRNAVEAQPEGGEVRVRLTRSPDRATIAVHNPGTVPKAVRATFFDKYATHGKAHGTGLGTYSAHLAARTLGGGIDMRTSEAEGTTVTVTLPG